MTHTDTRQSLLDAILDAPEDDLPRLVYADHLEEFGDAEDRARAEFIRLQIALWNECRDCLCGRKGGGHTYTGGQHHNGPCAADQMRVEVGGRFVRAKMREHELRDKIYEVGSFATFERGFVAKWRGPLQVWLDHGPAVMARHPVVRVETEKKPINYATIDPNEKVWLFHRCYGDDDPNAGEAWFLPQKVYSKLTASSDFELAEYANEEAGLADLSTALIALARPAQITA